MTDTLTANASIVISAPAARVWEALVTPAIVKQYMFGADVVSEWKQGSSITYRGKWEGKPYEDKGTIIEIEPPKLLKSSYFSALSGLTDKPENYNIITYSLTPESGATRLTVTQSNNPSKAAVDQA